MIKANTIAGSSWPAMLEGNCGGNAKTTLPGSNGSTVRVSEFTAPTPRRVQRGIASISTSATIAETTGCGAAIMFVLVLIGLASMFVRRRSRDRPIAAATQVGSLAIVVYRNGTGSNVAAIAAAPLAGSSLVFLFYSLVKEIWSRNMMLRLPTPVNVSLASLATDDDGTVLCIPLFPHVNTVGEFFLGAWDTCAVASFVEVLFAYDRWWKRDHRQAGDDARAMAIACFLRGLSTTPSRSSSSPPVLLICDAPEELEEAITPLFGPAAIFTPLVVRLPESLRELATEDGLCLCIPGLTVRFDDVRKLLVEWGSSPGVKDVVLEFAVRSLVSMLEAGSSAAPDEDIGGATGPRMVMMDLDAPSNAERLDVSRASMPHAAQQARPSMNSPASSLRGLAEQILPGAAATMPGVSSKTAPTLKGRAKKSGGGGRRDSGGRRGGSSGGGLSLPVAPPKGAVGPRPTRATSDDFGGGKPRAASRQQQERARGTLKRGLAKPERQQANSSTSPQRAGRTGGGDARPRPSSRLFHVAVNAALSGTRRGSERQGGAGAS